MKPTIEQIRELKKEIEGIWMHLDGIEKRLTENTSQDGDSFDEPVNETIEMLERMKLKVETQEQENEESEKEKLDKEIKKAFINANVKESLDELKRKLGIN